MKKTKKTHIFDDVFRTMEEYIPELMLPLINEVFHTNYSDDVIVTRLADKRHIFQNLIETDSCLSIGGKLYVLLPYYILRYEKQLGLIEREENRRQKLLEEYDNICLQLCNTLGRENPLGYSELHKLIARVLDYVLQKSNETKKEVQQVMGGHILESWKDEMIRIGREEGLAEGHAEGHAAALTELMTKKLKNGKTLEQIAAELELPLEEVNELYQKIKETR